MSITKLLVSFAYYLESSSYKDVKAFFYDLLENSLSRKKVYFDFFMIFLVLGTVAILIYDIKHELPVYLETAETVAIVLFILEWLGRFWISSDIRLDIIDYHESMVYREKEVKFSKIVSMIFVSKVKFIFSPMSIIDLLAILPSYRPLRILRIFLLFRLFKIIRYTQSINSFFRIFIEKRFEFNTLLMMSLFAIFISATVMYIYEGVGNNPNINSYFDSIYWAVITMSTIGYGDITPVTLTGRFVTLLLVAGGFSVIVFATSIVTSALNEKMEVVRENRIRAEASRLSNIVVIFGFGRMGECLADELFKTKRRFIVVDSDPLQIIKAKDKNYLILEYDASKYYAINEIVFKNSVQTVVALTDNDAVNLSILLTVKAERENINVIVRANNEENINKFKIAKADNVIFPNKTVAEVAVEYVGNPVAFDAIDNILLEKSGTRLDEVEILNRSPYIGKNLKVLNLEDLNLTLVAIIQSSNDNSFVFNPNPDSYILNKSDVLVLVGLKESIKNLKKAISKGLL